MPALDIIVAGFSESRYLVDALSALLHCTRMVGFKDQRCTRAPEWRLQKNTTFLSTCRNADPIARSGRCADGDTLAWAWESFATVDPRLEAILNETKPTGRRRALVYSVGPHYFSQFEHHNHRSYYVDASEWPEEWLARYYDDVKGLMRWLHHWSRDARTCVLWKTNNIGTGEEGSVHPSRRGGVHHWLNRWAVAMAHETGVRVVDVQPLTLNMSVAYATDDVGKQVADLYHGYNHSRLAEHVLREIERECGRV